MGLPSPMGPMLAAAIACFVNIMGLFMTWKGRAQMIYDVMNAQIDKAKKKVVDVIDTVDDMILDPLQKLIDVIDDMADEQKPALDKIKLVESTLKIDVPDPGDLKKPLDGCDDMIEEFVNKAKVEIPNKMDELVDMTFAGRVATDPKLWLLYAVSVPVGCVFLVNLSIALIQAYLSAPAAEVAGAAETSRLLLEEEETSHRMLRGNMPKIPKAPGSADLMPYLQPAITQVVAALLQVLASMIMSQGPRVAGLVNSAI